MATTESVSYSETVPSTTLAVVASSSDHLQLTQVQRRMLILCSYSIEIHTWIKRQAVYNFWYAC